MDDVEVKSQPVLAIQWDQAYQRVILNFARNEFLTWPFVIAVLDMAKMEAKAQMDMARIQAIQNQAAEMQMAERVRKLVH